MEKLRNFDEFISHVEENQENERFNEMLNEGLKSSILQKMVGNKKGDIGKRFFDVLSRQGIAASDITNLNLIVVPVADAATYTKNNPTHILIYYSENEKTNPYAGRSAWRDEQVIASDIVLAVVKNKTYQGLEYDRWASKKPGKAQYKMVPDGSSSSIGIDKSRGEYSANLNTLKKIAEVTDIVYAIDPQSVAQSTDKRAARNENRKGATAFVDDREFKKENQARYEQILQDKAAKTDIDQLVQDAINELSEQIKKGLSKGDIGRYGDIIIGLSPKKREVKMSDASNLMSSILNEFGRYVSAKNDAEKSKETHKTIDNYYVQSAARYAKSVKDYCAKIPTLNYAW